MGACPCVSLKPQLCWGGILRYAGQFAAEDDPDMALVRHVLARLAKNPAAQDIPWTISIIKAPGTLDAITLPSGHLVFFDGLLDLIERDHDQLAFLIGHEMSHVICHHLAERMSLAHFVHDISNILFLAAFSLLGDVFGFASLFGLMIAGDKVTSFITNRNFSRDNEYEADRVSLGVRNCAHGAGEDAAAAAAHAPPWQLGLLMAAEACYDPRKATQIWRQVAAKRMFLEAIHPPEWCNTHPTDEHRRCAGSGKIGVFFFLTAPRPLLARQALEAMLPEVMEASSPHNCPNCASWINAAAEAFYDSADIPAPVTWHPRAAPAAAPTPETLAAEPPPPGTVSTT